MSSPSVPSVRQLLVFESVARTENVSRAAAAIHVSQPAVTQAVARLEHDVGAPLFSRRSTGCYLTEAGEILQRRTARLFAQLDQALAELGISIPRGGPSDLRSIERKLSQPQMRALLAIAENGSFAAAARSLAMSEASIHRAARELELVLRRPLFHRTAQGLTTTKPAAELARRVKLAMQEIERAVEEIEASQGRNRGRIGLGLLPLGGAFFVVARALKDVGEAYPDTRIEAIDGSFDFLLEKLRSGGIDFIVGPVRGLDSSLGMVETVLFDDPYALVVRSGHPLTRKRRIRRQDLLAYDWVVPPPGTPRRTAFDALFAGLERPRRTLQTNSPNLTRAILAETDRITLLSRHESRAEQEIGFLTVLPFAVPHTARQVQVTTRADWLPTAVQVRFLQALQDQARGPNGVAPLPRAKRSLNGSIGLRAR